jgi:predicted lipase
LADRDEGGEGVTRYYLVHDAEILHEGDSAGAAVAAFYAAWNHGDGPVIVAWDGDTLRAHTLNDLEWDAVAEEAREP